MFDIRRSYRNNEELGALERRVRVPSFVWLNLDRPICTLCRRCADEEFQLEPERRLHDVVELATDALGCEDGLRWQIQQDLLEQFSCAEDRFASGIGDHATSDTLAGRNFLPFRFLQP